MATIEAGLVTNGLWLETARLRLWALPRPALARLHFSLARFAIDSEVRVARSLLTDDTRRSVARKLSRMQAEPEALHAWHTYWLIVLARQGDQQGAGLVGFKGPPDERGEAEIAYVVDPLFRGRGIATRAAGRLIAWAFEHPDCQAVIAPDVQRANAASQRVLEKLGMTVHAATAATQSWRLDRRDWDAALEARADHRAGTGQATGQAWRS
jgi:ribosomal-protein-alanine N-acetyltransferase